VGFYYFPYSGLVNAITSIFLGLFVLTRNPHSSTNRSFSYFAFSVGFWSCCYFVWQLSKSPEAALFWCRTLMVGAIFIPSTFFHFCVTLVNQQKKYFRVIIVWYLVSIVFLALDFTPLFVQDVRPRLIFAYWPTAGPSYAAFLAMFIALTIHAHVLLFKAYRNLSGYKRNQIKYVFLGTAIGFIGGSTNYPLWYNINILPIGNILVSLYVAAIAYAIIRHQLMDIGIIIKKTLVFTSLFIFSFGLFVAVTLLTQELIGGGRFLGLAISAIIIILAVRPLEDFLIKITDKFLFQKKYDYKQVLKSFIDEVIVVFDLDKIVSGTMELLDKTLHPTRGAMLLLDKDEGRYTYYGNSALEGHITLKNISVIPNYLRLKKDILSVEEENRKNLTKELQNEMDELDVRLAVPLMVTNELIGIVLLGKKKSDEYYAVEDLNILRDLARTDAVAINNARTHAKLLESQEKEQESEHMLSMAYMVTNLSHELRNPFQMIKSATDTTLDAIDVDAKKLPPDEETQKLLSYIAKKLKSVNETSDKGSKMLNSILDSMKIDKEKFTALDIRKIAGEAMQRARIDTVGTKIKLVNSVSGDFSKVMGDHITLEQVFFNLLTNAVQAMTRKNKGNRIEINAFDAGSNVRIELSDNGPGIPGTDVGRIFEPFYTTKDNLHGYASGASRGTGLGLMIVYQNVTSHDGTITVESEEGKGAKFIITLPKSPK